MNQLTDIPTVAEAKAAIAKAAAAVASEKAAELRRYADNRTHTRSGITKNHGKGTPKAKRLQAKRSRRMNRGK